MASKASKARSTKDKCTELLKVNGKGWNTAIFVDNNLAICSECKHVCRDPVELGCDHADDDIFCYCKCCLMGIIDRGGGLCPINGHANPTVCSLRAQRRQIAKAMVVCPHALSHVSAEHDVCVWSGTLMDLIDGHLTECTKRNDPSYFMNSEIEELRSKVNQLQIQNVALRAQNRALKQNQRGKQSHCMLCNENIIKLQRLKDENASLKQKLDSLADKVHVGIDRNDPNDVRAVPSSEIETEWRDQHNCRPVIRPSAHPRETLVYIGGIPRQVTNALLMLRRIEKKYAVHFNNHRNAIIRRDRGSGMWGYINPIPMETREMASKLIASSPLKIEWSTQCVLFLSVELSRIAQCRGFR